VVTLDSLKSVRVKPRKRTRISCLSGVIWVTSAGDPRDFILARGESVDVKGGLTLVTALEPTVVSITRPRAPWWQRVLRAGRSLLQSKEPAQLSADVARRLYNYAAPVPYY
jgi:hypothetical protein